MQERCLRLMGKKLLVALSLEGKFAGEGLQALDDGGDLLTSMARELVEKGGIGEGADAVWKQLNGEHQRLFAASVRAPVSEPERAAADAPADMPSGETMIPVLALGRGSAGWRRASRRVIPTEQGSLFD